MEIGKTIRKLRLQAGLTQEELANRSNLTKGFISQLESDYTSPSIATLEDIAATFAVPICDFFTQATQAPKTVVFKQDDWVLSGKSTEGVQFFFPIPQAHAKELESVFITLEPGEATEPESGHPGEEFGYLLRGNLELHLGSERHRVKKGDCFYYSAYLEHQIVNTGKRRAELLWVSSPPSF